MTSSPAAILEAALAAAGVPTVSAEGALPGGVMLQPSAAGAAPTAPAATPPAAPAPSPAAPAAVAPPTPQSAGSEPPQPSQLTPDELRALAAQNAEPTPTPAAGPTPAAPAPDPLYDRLVATGLTPDAARVIANQANGTAALHQRLSVALDQIDRLTRPAPVPPPPFDASSDPHVKFYSDRIAQTDTEIQAVEQEVREAYNKGNKANIGIATAQNAIALLSKLDSDEARRELSQAQADLVRHQSAFDAAKNEHATSMRTIKQLQRNKRDDEFQLGLATTNAKNAHQQSVQYAQESDRTKQAFNHRANQEFDGAIMKHCGAYGIQPTDKLRKDLEGRFEAHVQALPPHLQDQPVDFNVWVGAELDSMAQTWGLTRKADFTAQARATAAAAAVPRPASPPASLPATPAAPSAFANLPVEQQAEAARLHARAVLTGGR